MPVTMSPIPPWASSDKRAICVSETYPCFSAHPSEVADRTKRFRTSIPLIFAGSNRMLIFPPITTTTRNLSRKRERTKPRNKETHHRATEISENSKLLKWGEVNALSLRDRVKASCGVVLGKKTSSLIFFPAALHIGRDALHRGPSPSEGPFSDPTASSGKSISAFSVSRAERAVNPVFFAFSFFRAFVIKLFSRSLSRWRRQENSGPFPLSCKRLHR